MFSSERRISVISDIHLGDLIDWNKSRNHGAQLKGKRILRRQQSWSFAKAIFILQGRYNDSMDAQPRRQQEPLKNKAPRGGNWKEQLLCWSCSSAPSANPWWYMHYMSGSCSVWLSAAYAKSVTHFATTRAVIKSTLNRSRCTLRIRNVLSHCLLWWAIWASRSPARLSHLAS